MSVTSEAVAAVLADCTCGPFGLGAEIELGHMAPLNVSCDQLCAIGGFVSREYGDYGYTVEYLRTVTGAVTVAQVRHFDGSRFIVAADKWGSVRRVDNTSVAALAAEVTEMHNRAVAP